MRVAPLASVLESLTSGGRPKGGVSADSGDITSVGGEHLTVDGRFDFTNIKRIPRSFFAQLRGGQIAQLDVLVVKDGATTGKVALVDEDFPFDEAAVNEHVFCARIDQQVASPRYIYQYLRSSQGQRGVLSDFRGATVGGISREFAARTLVPLPPLREQRRIAEILDRAEALRAKRRAALAFIASADRSLFLDLFGDPVTNARAWPTKKLGELGRLERGVSKHRPRNAPELLGGVYPLVQTGEVAGSQGYIRSHHATYSELGLRQSKLWPTGTLCITIAANIAKAGILTFDACFPDSVVGFEAEDPATVEFVRVWLSFFQQTLESNAPESAQKNINLAILRSLEVTVPPTETRRQFAAAVAHIERLRLICHESMQRLDALFASLQHRAFRGEL